MLKFKEVLGYHFVDSTMDELVGEVHSRIVQSQKTFIVTANPEIITFAQSNPSYDEVIKSSDYITPDGIGIVIASKILGRPLRERLAGFDLMLKLLELSDKEHYRVYLLGTKPNIIDLSASNIIKAFPNLEIVGFHHGYFQSDEKIIKEIQQKQPDLVFVGLGFPKQEKWISENLTHFTKGMFVGVGGCLNIWAGVTKRAPRFMVNLNLEWLYRLIKEPSRSKRMLAIPIFLKRVFHREFK
ncbi:WecB/TagA/CpsF family glycosyltransferase [Neobacillus vireti]|uniref:N-acetylglucosaminyldiphosphoundecaprenol N-acetyl-beta-D-mannosaminyltransferase n=1 Tax=Neobacillus vireti LMG 21834 TaxID=1131730 RepID=A0AB94IPZ7_9BACI|nr:WecB/TagA/CpsF family glycosyltransferase [Neobacillus vireti]ETI69155.1 N-acetylglucosaminyldiphosphoundecaprenol N-acetyl-beta-D-mannosaminyltransferase [Neobacillus vireti LMG 21834]KLT15535.1 acetylglucosaminyldiphospho-UDP acetyl-beta-D-mannosaminyltransferase [Neobacillus vireti]